MSNISMFASVLMLSPDIIGMLAGLLTIITFVQRQLIPMRCTAISANLCFLTYAHFGHMMPILILHGILLPVNILRLSEALVLRRKVPQLPILPEDTSKPPCGCFSIF